MFTSTLENVYNLHILYKFIHTFKKILLRHNQISLENTLGEVYKFRAQQKGIPDLDGKIKLCSCQYKCVFACARTCIFSYSKKWYFMEQVYFFSPMMLSM